MDLTDILIELKNENEKYFREPIKYVSLIKQKAEKLFGKQIRTFLFGSTVKGNFTPLSDIDVLVMVPGLKPGLHNHEIVHLKEDFETGAPFSIILCNENQFEEWFRPFILDKFVEV